MARTDLELAEQKHRYRFHGEDLPSVTQITGLIDDNKAARMAAAAVRITKEGGDYRKVWKDKADRGTRVHGNIERWLAGETAEVQGDDEGYLDAAEKFLTDRPHEWLFTERVVIGDGYGGRIDTIGKDLATNGRSLIDWKTGKPYDAHLMQLAAYVYANGFAVYDENGSVMDYLQEMPRLTAASCVYLNEGGTYEERRYWATDLHAAYDAFMGLLDVHRWLRRAS